MKEIIIIETSNANKLKTILTKNHIEHQIIYNETLTTKKPSKKDKLREYIEMKSKEDIFADYGKALQDKELEAENKKLGEIYRYEVRTFVDSKHGKALIDQIKTVDKKRLIKKLGQLTEKEMDAIHEKLLGIFDLWEYLKKRSSAISKRELTSERKSQGITEPIFHKIVEMNHKITFAEADENPEKDKPVKNNPTDNPPNSLPKKPINNQFLLQYFQKNSIKSIKLEDQTLIVEKNDNSISASPFAKFPELTGLVRYLENRTNKKVSRQELETKNNSDNTSPHTKPQDNT
ncbi:4236_t:CDS:2 [Funneliformis geosporum]|uniref:4236_t:CDS:1 n=1 Tax=Funneliformis geosporum TaxID=1117311 RepID=A0A9W4X3L4_9GLOM|nr:4236_t:CDS:2 [Funneliformis geosporum]